MSEYTPTTEEIRDYVEVGGEPRPWEPPNDGVDAARAAAFDRWLAAHDADVERKAKEDLLIELLPVLEEALSNACLCQNDRGVGNEWDDEIAAAQAARDRAREAADRRKEQQ